MRYGSRRPEVIEEDERPLGSVSWTDSFNSEASARVHTFNDPRCPDDHGHGGIRTIVTHNIPALATYKEHEQYRAMNRRKGVEEE